MDEIARLRALNQFVLALAVDLILDRPPQERLAVIERLRTAALDQNIRPAERQDPAEQAYNEHLERMFARVSAAVLG